MAHTEESLRKLLNKIATEQKYEKPEIIIKEISSGGANYTSKLFTVIIREETKEDLHLFAKVATLGEKVRNEMPVKVYDTEIFAYTKLLKIYASLEEENTVPEEHRLYFTKFYGYDSEMYQETLVLENLLAHGYGPHDRFHSITWEYASSAIADLSKMHALSFALSEQYPDEFQKTFEALQMDWSGANTMMKSSVEIALKTVHTDHKEVLENFFDKNNNLNIETICSPIRRTTIIHSDFRGNNLLHRVREVLPFLRLQAVNFSTFTKEDIPQHFNDLLHKIAKEQNFVNYDLDVQPFSSGGANFTSKLYTVTISEGSRGLHMFAKVAAVGELIRDQVPKVYDIERYCYTKLVNRYEKMQNDFQVPDEHKLAFPKCYGCNPTRLEETIVLQNLAMDGYLAFDRFKSIDWPYACSAVEQLAKMHAISMAHWKYYPEEFETVMDKFRVRMNYTNASMKRYFENVTTRAIALVDKKNSDKLSRFFDVAFDEMETYDEKFQKSRRAVLNHGDYKPSNLMHKHLDDGKVDIKIVDLQTLQGGSPLTDLIYFIFTGSDEEFRAKYFDKLIEHYYTELCAAMKRLNLEPEEIFSREDFDYELKEKLPYGLTLAVFTLPIITVDSANAPEVNENLDVSNFAVERTSDLYTERLNGVVNDYVKWGILK